MDARLIVDPPAAGDWNMAVDEALLESVGQTSVPTLRFYSWSEPTLSLGYFQRWEERHGHAASVGCPLVRRATGGGAIVHDQELTYSLTLPTDFREASGPQLYLLVHGAIIDVLGEFGIRAESAQCADSLAVPIVPFLCFLRRGEGDVLVEGWKICGSAQRQRKNAVLQQGSILLARSKAAPELPGLGELGCPHESTLQLAERLWTRLGELLRFQWQRNSLAPEQLARAAELRQTKFADLAWNERR